jgi:hypothetical protein
LKINLFEMMQNIERETKKQKEDTVNSFLSQKKELGEKVEGIAVGNNGIEAKDNEVSKDEEAENREFAKQAYGLEV